MEALIIPLAILFFAILIPFGLYRLKKLRKQGVERLRKRVGSEEILILDPKAVFYGFASRGTVQARELAGVWGLTSQAIYFESFDYGTAHEEIIIPLGKVTAMEVQKNFQNMGKAVLDGLLVVSFTDTQGKSEQIAWRFDDRTAAELKIRELTSL